MIKEAGSKAKFARLVKLNDRRVTDWARTRLPNAANLYEIGKMTGCSVDWLLGFDVPVNRDRARDDVELADDLAAFIAQRVARATGLDAKFLQVSGRDVLEAVGGLEITAYTALLSRNEVVASLLMRQRAHMKPEDRPAIESPEWRRHREDIEKTVQQLAPTQPAHYRSNVAIGLSKAG